MSIRYDLPRGQFFDDEHRYVNPGTVAEKLREAEAQRDALREMLETVEVERRNWCQWEQQADARFRSERLLRQKAESALAEVIRHVNGKGSRLVEYAYRIEQAAAKYDAEPTP